MVRGGRVLGGGGRGCVLDDQAQLLLAGMGHVPDAMLPR
jgi:hypothetical protein